MVLRLVTGFSYCPIISAQNKPPGQSQMEGHLGKRAIKASTIPTGEKGVCAEVEEGPEPLALVRTLCGPGRLQVSAFAGALAGKTWRARRGREKRRGLGARQLRGEPRPGKARVTVLAVSKVSRG
jgi:hypothetical protein